MKKIFILTILLILSFIGIADTGFGQLYIPQKAIVTAYNENDNFTPGNIMASGKKVYEGAIAFNGAELGTKVVIDDKEYTVEDRTLHDGVADIYKASLNEAIQFGIKEMNIWVRRE